MCENSIDALSLAAIERSRDDTLYTATAGGMGPETADVLLQLLQILAIDPATILIPRERTLTSPGGVMPLASKVLRSRLGCGSTRSCRRRAE